MTETLTMQASAAFGAGLLASLSPCVYPMIPLTIGFLALNASDTHSSRRLTLLAFFFGQVLTFASLGFAAVTLGEIFGFSSESRWVQLGTAVMMFAMAIISLKGELPAFMRRLSKLQTVGTKGRGLVAAFLVGLLSALIASPCTSPVLGAVLMTLATVESQTRGAFLMVCYALGMSVLFLGVGLGLTKTAALPRAGQWMVRLQGLSAILLIIGGLYYSARGLYLL